MRISGAQIFVRIYRDIINADFIVKVRPGAAAGVADVADCVASMDFLAREYRQALHVPVAGGNAVPMIEDDSAPVSAHEVGKHHSSVGRRNDLLPYDRPNINS